MSIADIKFNPAEPTVLLKQSDCQKSMDGRAEPNNLQQQPALVDRPSSGDQPNQHNEQTLLDAQSNQDTRPNDNEEPTVELERVKEPDGLDSLEKLFGDQPQTSTEQVDQQSGTPAESKKCESHGNIEIPRVVLGSPPPVANLKQRLLQRILQTGPTVDTQRTQAPVNYLTLSINLPNKRRVHGNHLMYYRDHASKRVYLSDGGSQVSVIPQTATDREDSNAKFALKGAGGRQIKTYGTEQIKLKLGSGYYRWTFIKADVKHAILGIDFMRHQLLIDPSTDTLVNRTTGEVIECTPVAGASSSLNVIIQDPILLLLQDRPELTSDENSFRTQKHNVVHFIHTQGGPIKAPSRQYNPAIREVIRRTFMEYLELGIVRYSNSDWSSPLAVVTKADGGYRCCGDYRALNRITRMDNYGLPLLSSFNTLMHGCTVYSKLDLLKAYHQIGVYGPHVHKTAVSTPIGLFEFLRMPFGLKTAGQTLQRFIDSIMREFAEFSFVYLDDVIVFSSSMEEHKTHLGRIFDKLVLFGLRLNLKKCEFAKEKLTFLGHEVDKDGVRPDQAKVEAIRNMPVPKTVGQVKRYLGMVSFYARHIPHFATLRSSLNVFLSNPKGKRAERVQLSSRQIADFHEINNRLSDATLLYHPRMDTTLTLHCDASDTGVGCVLNQFDPDLEQLEPIFFFSKDLGEKWPNQPIFRKELEAAFLAVKRLNKFLIGQKTVLFTDNKALFLALNNPKDQPPKEFRRMEYISQFVDEVHLVEGRANIVADALSRIEYDQQTLNSIRLDAIIDYAKLAAEQQVDPALQIAKSGDRFKLRSICANGWMCGTTRRMAIVIWSTFRIA